VLASATDGATAPAWREVYFKETGAVGCEVIAREALGPDASRPGPLIVEAADTTIVVPPEWRLSVEAGGLIALERSHA
jgi:N-methylhydantoinase A